jgi:hypothetical protein
MATCGTRACFHGAYSDRDKAERKADARKGQVLKRKVRGSVRYIVVTQRKGWRVKLGKVLLYGAAGLAVAVFGVALLKKWKAGSIPGAPAVTYSGGLDKSGAGAGVEYS